MHEYFSSFLHTCLCKALLTLMHSKYEEFSCLGTHLAIPEYILNHLRPHIGAVVDIMKEKCGDQSVKFLINLEH